MVYNAGVPGKTFQLATEVVLKTVRVTEKKVSSVLIGGHELEGPETKRFKSLTTETEVVQHAVCSLRGGGFQRLRLMPPTYPESIWDRLGHNSETIWDPDWETVWRPLVNRMAPKTWISRGFANPF